MSIRLAFVSALLVSLAQAQNRPLASALDELEQRLGVPFNYEDPRFACANDLQYLQYFSPPAQILVPKGGPLPLQPATSKDSPPAQVDRLRRLHESKAYPGRFALKQVGSVLTVEPTEVRGPDCKWQPSPSAFETRISFPLKAREATETLDLIFSTLSQKLGVKVGLSDVPLLSFVHRTVTAGAFGEPAGEVLVRLFEQLSRNPHQSDFSCHLLYDPSVKHYLAGIRAVQRPRNIYSPFASTPRRAASLSGDPVNTAVGVFLYRSICL
jgi:hypothetical protein